MGDKSIEVVRSWFRKAERDLETAKRVIEGENPMTDIACFHIQQSAEKYLKGLAWNWCCENT